MSAHPWPSDLSERAASAAGSLQDCHLCARHCGVDRTIGPEGAWCGLGSDAYVYKELRSHGEEAFLDPTWLIDLSGCSLRCLFCTEWRHITAPRKGPAIRLTPAWFTERLAHHAKRGIRSISFVGGEPTVNVAAVIAALADVPTVLQRPIVWNTNGLMSESSLRLLDGLVQTWVIDLKVASDETAQRWLGAGGLDYGAEVARTLDAVHPPSKPMLTSAALPSVVIRHLLMPDRVQADTLPLIERIARKWPHAVLNLMTMYLPFGPALSGLKGVPELRKMVTSAERDAAIAAAESSGLTLLIDGQATGT
ncbi:MAG: radical SAM protein [Myxococcales bacterium]|nr:radical SAM protein [Myxococcales bacterium]